MANILQSTLLVNFLYPLLLMFFISFGVLSKTNIFGKDKQQLNALVSLVISLIFVGAIFPKLLVENLVQFMAIGLVFLFVAVFLWGFISGDKDLTVESGSKIHKLFAFLIFGAIIFAVLAFSGLGSVLIDKLHSILSFGFESDWSSSFWTNFIVVAVILVVVAVVIGWNPFSKKIDSYLKLK
jgi:hypothetical protein